MSYQKLFAAAVVLASVPALAVSNGLKMTVYKTARTPTAEDYRRRTEALDREGFFHAALHDRLLAIKQGKASAHELEKVGESALILGRLEDVGRLAAELRRGGHNTSGWPVGFRVAVAAFDVRFGRLDAARSEMPDVNSLLSLPEGALKWKSLLLASLLEEAQGRTSNALGILGQFQRAPSGFDAGFVRLQRARLNYDRGQLSEALEDLSQLPKSSPAWYPGVLVSAWSAYRLKDYNLALGQLMTLHSPFLASKFNPESSVLEAISFYRMCYYESAGRSLARLRSRYGKLGGSIDRLRRDYGDRFKLVSLMINYARGQKAPPNGLNQTQWDLIVDGVLSQDPMSDADRSLLQANREETLLKDLFHGQESNRFLAQMRAEYLKDLDAARREYYREGLKTTLHALDGMKAKIAESMENALAVEVEINTRIRERLIAGKPAAMKDVDFDTQIKKGFEFWPFEGEYWRDETGGYAFATTDVCSEGSGS